MTRETASGGAMDFTYRFSAAANGGRVQGRLTSANETGTAPWQRTYAYDGFGNLTSVTDWLGLPVAVGRGGPLKRYRYDPYGEDPTERTDTGLDYAMNRFCQRSHARFFSPDPYAASGGAGDPVNFNDPVGLARCTAFGSLYLGEILLFSFVDGAVQYDLVFQGGTSGFTPTWLCQAIQIAAERLAEADGSQNISLRLRTDCLSQ